MNHPIRIAAVAAAPDADGFTRLDLADERFINCAPAWMLAHRPVVGSYVMEAIAEHGCEWIVLAPQALLLSVEIATLSLNPGDVLVATTQGPIERDDAERLRRHLKSILPNGAECIVKTRDIEFAVITPEPERKYTFDQFVQYGRDNGGNIVGGMPWSFQFHGRPVSHENDNCYLITTKAGKTMRFERGDVLVLGADDFITITSIAEHSVMKPEAAQ